MHEDRQDLRDDQRAGTGAAPSRGRERVDRSPASHGDEVPAEPLAESATRIAGSAAVSRCGQTASRPAARPADHDPHCPARSRSSWGIRAPAPWNRSISMPPARARTTAITQRALVHGPLPASRPATGIIANGIKRHQQARARRPAAGPFGVAEVHEQHRRTDQERHDRQVQRRRQQPARPSPATRGSGSGRWNE